VSDTLKGGGVTGNPKSSVAYRPDEQHGRARHDDERHRAPPAVVSGDGPAARDEALGE
jgi:hypothetical protein